MPCQSSIHNLCTSLGLLGRNAARIFGVPHSLFLDMNPSAFTRNSPSHHTYYATPAATVPTDCATPHVPNAASPSHPDSSYRVCHIPPENYANPQFAPYPLSVNVLDASPAPTIPFRTQPIQNTLSHNNPGYLTTIAPSPMSPHAASYPAFAAPTHYNTTLLNMAPSHQYHNNFVYLSYMSSTYDALPSQGRAPTPDMSDFAPHNVLRMNSGKFPLDQRCAVSAQPPTFLSHAKNLSTSLGFSADCSFMGYDTPLSSNCPSAMITCVPPSPGMQSSGQGNHTNHPTVPAINGYIPPRHPVPCHRAEQPNASRRYLRSTSPDYISADHHNPAPQPNQHTHVVKTMSSQQSNQTLDSFSDNAKSFLLDLPTSSTQHTFKSESVQFETKPDSWLSLSLVPPPAVSCNLNATKLGTEKKSLQRNLTLQAKSKFGLSHDFSHSTFEPTGARSDSGINSSQVPHSSFSIPPSNLKLNSNTYPPSQPPVYAKPSPSNSSQASPHTVDYSTSDLGKAIDIISEVETLPSRPHPEHFIPIVPTSPQPQSSPKLSNHISSPADMSPKPTSRQRKVDDAECFRPLIHDSSEIEDTSTLPAAAVVYRDGHASNQANASSKGVTPTKLGPICSPVAVEPEVKANEIIARTTSQHPSSFSNISGDGLLSSGAGGSAKDENARFRLQDGKSVALLEKNYASMCNGRNAAVKRKRLSTSIDRLPTKKSPITKHIVATAKVGKPESSRGSRSPVNGMEMTKRNARGFKSFGQTRLPCLDGSEELNPSSSKTFPLGIATFSDSIDSVIVGSHFETRQDKPIFEGLGNDSEKHVAELPRAKTSIPKLSPLVNSQNDHNLEKMPTPSRKLSKANNDFSTSLKKLESTATQPHCLPSKETSPVKVQPKSIPSRSMTPHIPSSRKVTAVSTNLLQSDTIPPRISPSPVTGQKVLKNGFHVHDHLRPKKLAISKKVSMQKKTSKLQDLDRNRDTKSRISIKSGLEDTATKHKLIVPGNHPTHGRREHKVSAGVSADQHYTPSLSGDPVKLATTRHGKINPSIAVKATTANATKKTGNSLTVLSKETSKERKRVGIDRNTNTSGRDFSNMSSSPKSKIRQVESATNRKNDTMPVKNMNPPNYCHDALPTKHSTSLSQDSSPSSRTLNLLEKPKAKSQKVRGFRLDHDDPHDQHTKAFNEPVSLTDLKTGGGRLINASSMRKRRRLSNNKEMDSFDSKDKEGPGHAVVSGPSSVLDEDIWLNPPKLRTPGHSTTDKPEVSKVDSVPNSSLSSLKEHPLENTTGNDDNKGVTTVVSQDRCDFGSNVPLTGRNSPDIETDTGTPETEDSQPVPIGGCSSNLDVDKSFIEKCATKTSMIENLSMSDLQIDGRCDEQSPGDALDSEPVHSILEPTRSVLRNDPTLNRSSDDKCDLQGAEKTPSDFERLTRNDGNIPKRHRRVRFATGTETIPLEDKPAKLRSSKSRKKSCSRGARRKVEDVTQHTEHSGKNQSSRDVPKVGVATRRGSDFIGKETVVNTTKIDQPFSIPLRLRIRQSMSNINVSANVVSESKALVNPEAQSIRNFYSEKNLSEVIPVPSNTSTMFSDLDCVVMPDISVRLAIFTDVVMCSLCGSKLKKENVFVHPLFPTRMVRICKECEKHALKKFMIGNSCLKSGEPTVKWNSLTFVAVIEHLVLSIKPSDLSTFGAKDALNTLRSRKPKDAKLFLESLDVPYDMVMMAAKLLEKSGLEIRDGFVRWATVLVNVNANECYQCVTSFWPPSADDRFCEKSKGERIWAKVFPEVPLNKDVPSCVILEKVLSLIGVKVKENKCAHDLCGSKKCSLHLDLGSIMGSIQRAAGFAKDCEIKSLFASNRIGKHVGRPVHADDLASMVNGDDVSTEINGCCLCGSEHNMRSFPLRFAECEDCWRRFCSACIVHVIGSGEYSRIFRSAGYKCPICRARCNKLVTMQGVTIPKASETRSQPLNRTELGPAQRIRRLKDARKSPCLLRLSKSMRKELLQHGIEGQISPIAVGFAKMCELVNDRLLSGKPLSRDENEHVCLKCKKSGSLYRERHPTGVINKSSGKHATQGFETEGLIECGVPSCTNTFHIECAGSVQTGQGRRGVKITKWVCGHHQCRHCDLRDESKLIKCQTCPCALCPEHMGKMEELYVLGERVITCASCQPYVDVPSRVAWNPGTSGNLGGSKRSSGGRQLNASIKLQMNTALAAELAQLAGRMNEGL